MNLCARWLRFNAGGLYGFVLQLLALLLLSKRIPLSWATALAVELAVIHNFLWHEFYTWRDRHVQERGALLRRFIGFQATNGATSMVGNVVITSYLHARYDMMAVLANALAVIACSIINFVVSEWIVFARRPRPHPEDRETLFV